MRIPKLSFSSSWPDEAAVRVLSVVSSGSRAAEGKVSAGIHGGALKLLGKEEEAISAALSLLEFKGGRDEADMLPYPGAPEKLLVFEGLGNADKTGRVSRRVLRGAAGHAVRTLGNGRSLALAFSPDNTEELLAVVEGALLGAYRFNEYRSEPVPGPTEIFVVSDLRLDEQQLKRVRVIAESMSLLKDLGNRSGKDLNPPAFAQLVEQNFSALPAEISQRVKVTVWDEHKLLEESCGGIYDVGKGSQFPPRLVKIEYSPAPNPEACAGADATASKHLALVGKGITFDTGGMNLKTQCILGMKFDMSGAATVFTVLMAAARLALPLRITGYLCLAENMISKTANRPDDVIRFRNGKTAEITNTDAEGRLVMADGLSLASEEQPDAIIDIATLTGAARMALGQHYTGVMGNNEQLIQEVAQAARETDERFQIMPLDDEDLRPALKSNVADMVNSSLNRGIPGMQFAAVFLENFVGKDASGAPLPWVHLDIAGPADYAKPQGFTAPGASAVALRALTRLAENFSRPL